MVDRGFVFLGPVMRSSRGTNRTATVEPHHGVMLRRWLEKLRERRTRRLVLRSIEEAVGIR